MTGYSIAEVSHAEGDVIKWRGGVAHVLHAQNPSCRAKTRDGKFETICMVGGEDSLLFLGRVNKAADQLALLGSWQERGGSEPTYLSSNKMQSKSILARPNIPARRSMRSYATRI